MSDEVITLKILAQDLASGNIGKFVGGLDAMARKGGLVGSVVQGVGQSFGQMLNPIGLVTKGMDLVTGAVDGSVRAWEDQEKLNAQTAAALASTGDAAGVTADQVGSLADSIAAYSGQNDDAIQKGENLLLTFTNIKDAAGAGNDIFTETTKVMADMAQAMGGDAAGQAVLLGKALNDPVRGLTALTRVGVTFTNEQRAQIAAMVKVGDVAGAQKVILGELNKEFGGSAAAFGKTTEGAMDRAGIAIGHVQEQIGQQLTPAIAGAANALSDFLSAGADKPLSGAVQDLVDAYDKAAAAAGGATTEVEGTTSALHDMGGDKSWLGLLGIAEHINDLGAQMGILGGKVQQTANELQGLGDAAGMSESQLQHLVSAGFESGKTIDDMRAELQATVDAMNEVPPSAAAATSSFLHGARAASHLGTTFAGLTGDVDSFTKQVPHAMSRMVTESTRSLQTLGTSLHSAIETARKGENSALEDLKADLHMNMKEMQRKVHKDARDASEALHEGLASKNGATVADAKRLVDQLAREYALIGQMMPMNLGVDQIALNYKLNHRGQPGAHTHHAAGGVISPGTWGMVGEEGPEMIYNAGSGGIGVIPNGGGGDVHLHLHTATTPSPVEAQKFAQAFAPAFEDEMRRRGTLARR